MTIRSRPIIGLRVGERLQAVEPDPPAPSCTVTLEAPGALSVAGTSALDVDGQTASITLASDAGSEQWSATDDTGIEIGTFTGRRAVEHVNASSWNQANGEWVARGFYNDPPSADAVWRWENGAWKVMVGGAQQASYAGSSDDATAVVLVDDGSVEFWHGTTAGSMTLKNTVAVYSSGDLVKMGALTQGGFSGDSMSVEFKTADYSQNFNSADDWCGNAI